MTSQNSFGSPNLHSVAVLHWSGRHGPCIMNFLQPHGVGGICPHSEIWCRLMCQYDLDFWALRSPPLSKPNQHGVIPFFELRLHKPKRYKPLNASWLSRLPTCLEILHEKSSPLSLANPKLSGVAGVHLISLHNGFAVIVPKNLGFLCSFTNAIALWKSWFICWAPPIKVECKIIVLPIFDLQHLLRESPLIPIPVARHKNLRSAPNLICYKNSSQSK